jgi:hypothetical protein
MNDSVPSPSQGRVLAGAKAIADHLGITERQARHWADRGWIPTFRLGDRLCARSVDVDAAMAKLAEAGAAEPKREPSPSLDLPSAASLLRPRRPHRA